MDSQYAKRINRIQKSKLNATVTLATSIVMGVLSFAERTVFNHCFIADYLGLYSFFYNVIGVLGTLELGITTAIAFALYAPIEYKQYDQIAAIMTLFRRAYWIIGTLILIAGLALFPILTNLINTDIQLEKVQLYFSFFLFKTVFNYYLAYKRVLITANQNLYKVTLITNFSWCILYIAEMAISLTSGNFLYYCIAIFIADVFRSIVIFFLGKKEFPMLKEYRKAKLDPEITRSITRNVKGLILTRLGTVLVSTTDSMLISAMVSTAFLGKYSNYQMITNGLKSVSALIPQSITASIGNAGVTETRRSLSKSFETLNLASYLIYGYLTILIINIVNPIVSTFFGSDRVIPISSVILICISFYLTNQREILLTFKSSLGLYWEDRKRPIVEGLTNLITSIILGKFWGFNGIIIGTIISQICVNLMIEPQVIMHNGLHSSTIWYYVTTCIRFILTALISVFCLWINSFFELNGILEVIAKFLTTTLITIGIYYAVYRKNEDAISIIKTLKIAFTDKRKLKESKMEETNPTGSNG